MKASIYNGTKYEISWSLDDTLTDPTLIRNIEDAGNEIDIDWKKNEFYSSIELLLEHYSKIELIEKLQFLEQELLQKLIVILDLQFLYTLHTQQKEQGLLEMQNLNR